MKWLGSLALIFLMVGDASGTEYGTTSTKKPDSTKKSDPDRLIVDVCERQWKGKTFWVKGGEAVKFREVGKVKATTAPEPAPGSPEWLDQVLGQAPQFWPQSATSFTITGCAKPRPNSVAVEPLVRFPDGKVGSIESAELTGLIRRCLVTSQPPDQAVCGVRHGMTKQQVLDSPWGQPDRINTTSGYGVVREQWVYSSAYLYFENGVLTVIQTSR